MDIGHLTQTRFAEGSKKQANIHATKQNKEKESALVNTG